MVAAELTQKERKKKNLEVSNDIINALDAIDVCRICQLRLAGMGHVNHTVDDTPVKKESHCCICLGILEEYSLTSLAQKVAEILKAYDSPTFQFGFTVPQCVMLRQGAVIAHLIDNGVGTREEISSPKTVGRFFLNQLIKKFTNKEPNSMSQLAVKFDFKYESDIEEISTLKPLLEALEAPGIKRNNEGEIMNHYNMASVQKVIRSLSTSCVKNYIACPPPALSKPCDCHISVNTVHVYIGGRYNKYSRMLYTTPLLVDGERRCETSVLDLIGEPIKEFTLGDDIKFKYPLSEDVDVQILGSGHPFAVEVINPKRIVITKEQVAKLEAEINTSTDMISVHHLQVISRCELELMRKSDELRNKAYRAKLWCPEKISDDEINSLNLMKDIAFKQKTPIRLLNRRECQERKERKVHEIELKHADEDDHYELNVSAETGLYIKELVHGDLGRTEPSLRSLLGKPIDIVELDVIPTSLKWPSELRAEL